MSKDHTWLRKYFPKAKSTTVDKNTEQSKRRNTD